jgi:hypothetical protein
VVLPVKSTRCSGEIAIRQKRAEGTGQHVLAEASGETWADAFGLIGQDLLRQLGSYTIDFRSMRFNAP